MAEDGRLSFEADISDKGFEEGAKRIQQRVRDITDSVEKSGMTVDEFARHMQGVIASFDKLTQAVDKNTKAQEQVAQAGKKAADAEKQGADKATEAIVRTDSAAKELGGSLRKAGDEGAAGFDKLAKYAAGFFTLQKAAEFGKKIFEVRGEIQSLQTSFETLVGNKQQAEGLFNSIREFATSTPMQLKDLAGAAQTMMSFNIPVEQIMENLKALGDVSMGDAQKFQSLSLAFSQMSATGKLMGQDLLQMINAGFNPLATISEKTGKSISELKDEMSKGAISADMVRQAFIDATSEGGKFNGMLEAQSKTLRGAYSNLQGAIGDMFNSIGEQSEGIMAGTLSVATELVKNYENVGKVIMSLIATYGIYKAAVMTVTAVQGLQAAGLGVLTAAETVHYGWLVLCEKAQRLLNATMLANPYVAVATLITGVAAALWNLKSQQDLVNDAQDDYNRKKEETIAKEEEHKRKIDELVRVAGDESLSTQTRSEAMVVLMQKYPALFKNYNTEIEALKDIAYWKAKIAEIESGKSIQLAQNELADVNRQISELEAKSKRITKTTKNVYNHQTLQWERQVVSEPSITREEQARLQQLKNQRSKLNKQMKQDADTKYMADLTGVSNKDLQKQIDERKNLLAKISVMEQKGKKAVGKVQMGGVTGVYSKEEIEGQLTRLQMEQNRRTKILSDGSKNFASEARKAYDREKKELDRLRSLTDPNKRKSSKATVDIDGKAVRESDLSPEQLQEAIKKQQKVVTEAKKDLESLTGQSLKAGAAAAKKKQQQAIKDAEAEEKIQELKLKQQQESARREKELRMATAEAEIQSMADGSDKKLAQLELDRERELEAIEAYYEDLRQKRIDEAKQLWDADPSNKGRNFFDSAQYKQASSKELSLDEAENKLARINAAWAVWQRGVAGVQAEEAKAMNDYLKAYGTYQEKRQAIADDYNTRIQNAKTEGERLALQKELENETHALDEQYGLVTQSMADLFADASKKSVSSIQKVIDKYEALVRFMQGQNGTIYGSDGKAVSAGTGSVTREDLKNMGFSDSEIKGVQDGTISIKELTDRLKDLKGELKDRSPYQSFTANMKEIFKQFKNAKNADDFGTAIGNMCGEIQSFLPEIKEFGQDIANIFGVDDSKFTAVVEGLDGLMTAGQGVGQIMSGDIIGGVMSTVKGISQMADALDGAFGADYSSYNRLVEQYDKLIDVWDDLISKKEEYINMSYGAEAAKVGSEAIALVERETEAWRKLGKERLNAGASAGSHAIGRRMADNMTAEDWENIARALGMNVGSAQRTIGTSRMTGLFDLTAEQLQKLKEEAPEFWAKMDGDVQKYLQSIIDGSEKITELNEQIKEQLTSITFDSMYDSFVDLLSDMDASSKDFAENFEKYMFNAMLSTQIGQKYKQRLQTWYDQMARANEDSTLSEDEIKNLRNEWDAIVADALRERDSIAAATGYNSNSSYSQEGSSGGWQAMGQETADELNGRFTALQISGEKIAEGITSMLSLMASLTATGEEGGRTLSEIRNLMVTNNAHLEDILAVNKNMYRDFTLQLKKIANNS